MVHNFLVTGDDTRSRESLAVLLRSQGHTVTVAPTGADAVRSLRDSPVDTVLIVGDEGSAAAQRMRERIVAEQRASRVILVSRVLSGAGNRKATRFGIGKHRLSEAELLALAGAGEDSTGAEHSSEETEPGVEALRQVVDVLVGLRELNDVHHRGSSHRSTYLVRTVAEQMGLSQREVRGLEVAALLRDIGKVEVGELSDETGTFSASQRSRMQDHVTASVRLVEHIEFPWPVLPIVRHHHEHYDGTGYPDGLRGPEIPLGARILGAVDSYIAMLSDRPHRRCMSRSAAQEEMVRLTGKHFDPEVVEVLLRVIREGTVSLSSEERPRVLIAEPEMEFVKLLKFRLVNEGLEVDHVPSLEEGILEILDRSPNIVVTSVGKDKSHTLDLLRQLREDSSLRLLPVILLADSDDTLFKVRAFRLGVDDYLVKTAGLEEIVARIEGILAREALRGADDEEALPGITGLLENLPLPDIFQVLNLGLKTARVSLESEAGTGRIWFREGAAIHAEVGEDVGEAACFAMLGWKHGRFRIEHGAETDESSIEMDTMFIVMEGLRMIDETLEAAVESTPA